MPGDRPIDVLLNAIARLPRWQRLTIIAFVVLIVLTFLAACVVLVTIPGSS